MRIKRETYQKIHDLSDGRHGTLALGFTAGRGINMFTQAYAVFHQRFPQHHRPALWRELSETSKSIWARESWTWPFSHPGRQRPQ